MAEVLCDTRHPLCFTLSTLPADFVKLAAGIYTTTTADLCLLLKPEGGQRSRQENTQNARLLTHSLTFHFLFNQAERTHTCPHTHARMSVAFDGCAGTSSLSVYVS